MRKTPLPWIIGTEGIVSPSVKFEDSSWFNWRAYRDSDAHQNLIDRLYYQGELVCESASFEDQLTIVHAVRALPRLVSVLRMISSLSKESDTRELCSQVLLWVECIRKELEEEGRDNKAWGRMVEMIRYSRPAIYGYLPEFATRSRVEPPPPAYLPLRHVTDNIEQAWIARQEDELL